MKQLVIYIISIGIFSCNNSNDLNHTNTKNKIEKLVGRYLQVSQNKLVKMEKHPEWMFDRKEETDSVTYHVIRIGHTEGENSNNKRFVTSSWIYLDSLNQRIYEYDLVNDSLIFVR